MFFILVIKELEYKYNIEVIPNKVGIISHHNFKFVLIDWLKTYKFKIV